MQSLRFSTLFAGGLAVAGAFAACAGQTAPTTQTGAQQLRARSAIDSESEAKKKTHGLLYVTDNTFSSGSFITYYRIDATGNARPVGVIKGSNTQLHGPNGIVLDSRGEIYVGNSTDNDILGFPPGSKGNVAPDVIITTNTLHQAGGLAIDAADDLYVADCGALCGQAGADNVSVFAPGSNGNATPIAVITGPDTQLNGVSSVALDAQGNIYVTSRGSNAIVVFAAGANGDATPIDVIQGSQTQLDGPNGISVGPDGEIYTGLNSQAIGVYHPIPYPQSNVPPDRLIQGSLTQLSNPDDPILNAQGQILVTNRYANSVSLFAGDANGNAAPLTQLTGKRTQLEYPAYLYISGPAPTPSPSAGSSRAPF